MSIYFILYKVKKLRPNLDGYVLNEWFLVVTIESTLLLTWKAQGQRTLILELSVSSLQKAFPQQEQDSIEENYCSVNCCSNLTHNLASGIDSLQCQAGSFLHKKEEKINLWHSESSLCEPKKRIWLYFKISLHDWN